MIPTNHEIIVSKAGEVLDIWGNPIEVEPVSIFGNLRSEMGIMKDANGDERTYNYTVLFVGFIDIGTDDRIEFLEPNNELVSLLPIKVKFMRDLDGSVGYTKVVL